MGSLVSQIDCSPQRSLLWELRSGSRTRLHRRGWTGAGVRVPKPATPPEQFDHPAEQLFEHGRLLLWVQPLQLSPQFVDLPAQVELLKAAEHRHRVLGRRVAIGL